MIMYYVKWLVSYLVAAVAVWRNNKTYEYVHANINNSRRMDCLTLQRRYYSLKCQQLFTSQHDITYQVTWSFEAFVTGSGKWVGIQVFLTDGIENKIRKGFARQHASTAQLNRSEELQVIDLLVQLTSRGRIRTLSMEWCEQMCLKKARRYGNSRTNRKHRQ